METKRTCKYCGKTQPIKRFEIANVIKGKEYRRWKCRKCYRETKRKREATIRAWVIDLKSELICKKCGEDDFRVLDFHHTRDKEIEIPNAVHKGWGKERILKEMQKCDVLCCKCHRIHHWEEKHGV